MKVTSGVLDVGQGPIEYIEIAGASDLAPLVFLHEGLGSIELWRRFPSSVSALTGRRALVYSRHGYGRSAVAHAPLDRQYMHREALHVLPELLDELGYNQPILIGHSDGASIALIATGTAALTPTGLVLLAPHVIVEDVSISSIEAAEREFKTTDMAQRMGKYHYDPERTFRNWSDIWLSPAFRSWDIRHVLSGVSCPALLIQGMDDEYGTLKQLDLIEAGVSGQTQRVELSDCRHAPHLDQPDATGESVMAFLSAMG